MMIPVNSEARLARMAAGIDAIVDPDRPRRERRQARAASVWLALGVVGFSAAAAATYIGVGRVDRPETRVAVPETRVPLPEARPTPKSFFASVSETLMPTPVATRPRKEGWYRPSAPAAPRTPTRAADTGARAAAERFQLAVDQQPVDAPAARAQGTLTEGQELAVPLRGEALEAALARDRERTRRSNRDELDRLPEEP